ncbi:hypothetical protein AGMMS49959_13360 [Planctomycetales bacterium]|nr:hypothetical protein AGMMS49959_13360 [Planctomycetales bacterium]
MKPDNALIKLCVSLLKRHSDINAPNDFFDAGNMSVLSTNEFLYCFNQFCDFIKDNNDRDLQIRAKELMDNIKRTLASRGITVDCPYIV